MKKNGNDANIINKLLAMQSNSCSHVISKYPHIPSKETSGILSYQNTAKKVSSYTMLLQKLIA